MVVILVHWHIHKNKKDEFLSSWKIVMDPLNKQGLYFELLTEVKTDATDPRYHSFDIENPNYLTFVNIGVWNKLADFEEAIGGFLPPLKEIFDEKAGEMKVQILMSTYEYKLRDRIVLNKVELRFGDLANALFRNS